MNRQFRYRQEDDQHILELIFLNHETNALEVANIPYNSERFHTIITYFEKYAHQETVENKRDFIRFLIACRYFLREKDDYYLPAVEKIFNFFLKLDKNTFAELTEENLYQYARKYFLSFIVANDLIDSKHKIHILLFRVIAKFSSISESSFDSFIDNDIYRSISGIIGLYIDYIKENNNGSQQNLSNLFETLNYCLYILYRFSLNTKIYLKEFDTIKMIDRTRYILSAYLNKEQYLICPRSTPSSPNYTPSIILCSLLCYFNNLITNISKKDLSSIFDDKFIMHLVNLSNEFVLHRINLPINNNIFDYQIGTQAVINNEYVKYFDDADVLKSINRFLIVLDILKDKLEEKTKFSVSELRRSLDTTIKQRKNLEKEIYMMDTILIQSNMKLENLTINDNEDIVASTFENRFKENEICYFKVDEIVAYLDILRDDSKTNEGLDRLEANVEFLKLFLEKIIKGLNKNYVNLQVLYKKDTIEQIMMIISKTLSNEKLCCLIDLWFVFLLKIILRQSLYSGRRHPIAKTSFELFFSVLSIDKSSNFFDFCDEDTGVDNFVTYYTELISGRILKYNNVKFLRDLCLYYIIMIAGKIHIIFDNREAFFNITYNYLASIFQIYCESSEEDAENVGSLTLFEIFSYISQVVPTFMEKYCSRNQLIEGETVHIFDWLKIFYQHVSSISGNHYPDKLILTYKFTVRAVLKCLEEVMNKNLVVWKRKDFYMDIVNSLNSLPMGENILIKFECFDFI